MDQELPPPPLLGRIRPGAWTALTWGAAVAFASAFYGLRPNDPLPGKPHPSGLLHLGLGAWAALAVATALPIGLARRWPLPVLALMLAESVAAVVFLGRPWALFLAATDVLVLYVAATRPRRIATAAAVVALAAELGGWRIGVEGAWQPGLLGVAAPIASATVIAWMAGNSICRRREYGESLRAQAALRAVQAERLRIARELHDMVAHSIGIVAIQAGAAGRVIDVHPAGAREALGVIESTSRETLAGLRRMLGALRQAEADAPRTAPAAGLEAVDRLTETSADAGVRVEVHWHGERRPLPPEVDLAAFRIIQESVTNTVRHSGTDHCRVSVEYRDEELAIEIVDDGRGPVRTGGTAGSGYGIAGMRERVALLHGRFSAGSRPEGGFRVAARLPA